MHVGPLSRRRFIASSAAATVAVMGPGMLAAQSPCMAQRPIPRTGKLRNPGVTSVLAATSNPVHMLDNARAGMGRLPDEVLRRRMVAHLQSI
ncbi:MAG TPA: twin-arginine translocation signal domain-containing protein [Gammaproteobacteria bacterium]|nr:twin-arginine translocation signal domain-containing protein [Gammaproteobacteria bacterium]